MTDIDLFRLVAEISRTFVGLAPDHVDEHIESAIGRVASLVGADRVTATQMLLEGPAVRRTHQWARAGIPLMPGEDSASPFPWIARQILSARVPVVFAGTDRLPADAARDRSSLAEFGIKSLAAFPMTVGDSVIGALSFATLERHHEWPAGVQDALRLFAEIVGSALARKRSQVDLERTLGFERLLASLSTTFASLASGELDAQI